MRPAESHGNYPSQLSWFEFNWTGFGGAIFGGRGRAHIWKRATICFAFIIHFITFYYFFSYTVSFPSPPSCPSFFFPQLKYFLFTIIIIIIIIISGLFLYVSVSLCLRGENRVGETPARRCHIPRRVPLSSFRFQFTLNCSNWTFLFNSYTPSPLTSLYPPYSHPLSLPLSLLLSLLPCSLFAPSPPFLRHSSQVWDAFNLLHFRTDFSSTKWLQVTIRLLHFGSIQSRVFVCVCVWKFVNFILPEFPSMAARFFPIQCESIRSNFGSGRLMNWVRPISLRVSKNQELLSRLWSWRLNSSQIWKREIDDWFRLIST